MEVLNTGNLHTRALWVGTWAPSGNYFVTGARDKKLVIWKQKDGYDSAVHDINFCQVFQSNINS